MVTLSLSKVTIKAHPRFSPLLVTTSLQVAVLVINEINNRNKDLIIIHLPVINHLNKINIYLMNKNQTLLPHFHEIRLRQFSPILRLITKTNLTHNCHHNRYSINTLNKFKYHKHLHMILILVKLINIQVISNKD